VLSLSIYSILYFPLGHPVPAYGFILILPSVFQNRGLERSSTQDMTSPVNLLLHGGYSLLP